MLPVLAVLPQLQAALAGNQPVALVAKPAELGHWKTQHGKEEGRHGRPGGRHPEAVQRAR